MVYLPEALKARRDALAANHRASERAVSPPANTPGKPSSVLSDAQTAPAPDLEALSDLARLGFVAAKADFNECGHRLVTQMARLRSLSDLCARHAAEQASKKGPRARQAASSAAGAGEDALTRIRAADRIIYELPTPAEHAASGCPIERDRLTAEFANRGVALIQLTANLNGCLGAVQAQIGAMASSLFDVQPDTMKGGLLRQLIADARIDIAAELLQSGLSETLVADLTRLDADVTLALAAEVA
jgi:hypothetical protein